MNAYTRYTDGHAANEAITNRANYNAVMFQLLGISSNPRVGINWEHRRILHRALAQERDDSFDVISVSDDSDSEDSDSDDSDNDSEDSDNEDSDSGDISDSEDGDNGDISDSEDGDNGWRAYGGNGIDPDIWEAWVTPTRELAQ